MKVQQSTIWNSELIITERGTIYHLDLAPEMLADTVITVGDPGRVKTVSKYFDRSEYIAQHREFITHTGYIGSKRISVVSSGIGPDNVDIVVNELDALANINFSERTVRNEKKQLNIIRLGTSGALQPDIEADSLVVSSFGIGLDNLMHFYQYQNNPEELYIINEFIAHTGLQRKHIQPYIAEGAIKLRKHFGEGFVHGITVTCPGFYGPQARMLRAPLAVANLLDALTGFSSRQDRILNFEMETSALYGLGNLLGHNCMSVNTIINNRATKQFSQNMEDAVEQMIKRSLEIIEQMP